MKTLFKVLIIGFLSLSANITVAQDKQQDHQQIKVLLDTYAESVNNLDYDKAALIWLNSSEVSFIHPRGYKKRL